MTRSQLALPISALCFFCLAFLLCSCHKSNPPAVSQDFYISFTAAGSDIRYETGTNFQYLRGGSQATQQLSSGVDFEVSPAAYISPLPTNVNVYTAGFVFGYDTLITSYVPPNGLPYANIGDLLFSTGQRSIFYTGINYAFDGNIGELSRTDPKGVTIFWTTNSVVLNSGSSLQPTGNFFHIDSVLSYHHDDPLSLKTYDKIISGTFQCRVYNPTDTTQFYDLLNGRFRMPIWRNSAD